MLFQFKTKHIVKYIYIQYLLSKVKKKEKYIYAPPTPTTFSVRFCFSVGVNIKGELEICNTL